MTFPAKLKCFLYIGVFLFSLSLPSLWADALMKDAPLPETSAEQTLFENPQFPTETRVRDLLKRMTLEEKCEQLQKANLANLQIFEEAVSQESLERLFREYTPGVVLMEAGASAQVNAIKARDLQEYLVAKSRFAIPPLFVIGGGQGLQARGTTVFPSPLAQGSTWAPGLVREMAARIATEASTLGVAQLLAPSFALGRDPRFGGIEQCFGECPTLVTEMALAFFEGLQGVNIGDAAQENTLAPNKVFGTAMHFAGWASTDRGLYGAPVSLSARALRALHFPPFEAAVHRARAQAVVPVVSSVNSVPAHANEWLLDTVLRQEWHFPGYVLSAPHGVAMNSDVFAIARDNVSAAVQAACAGVDVETGSNTYRELAAAVRRGEITESVVDNAVARVLRLKFLAGLFDGRRPLNVDLLPVRLHVDESRSLARKVAVESIILLKNTDGFLPLDSNRIKTLAVIGPNADRLQFGDGSWCRDNDDGVTVLHALRTSLGSRTRVLYAEGCEVSGSSRTGFEAAVAVAKKADAVLVVLGDESATTPVRAREGWLPQTPTVGAGYDTATLSLPGVQNELAKALAATGRPIIVLLLQGRPHSTVWIKENATAVLGMFFAGEEQGNALADILFGKADPGGRLPLSVARSAGHLPTTYDYKPGERGIYGQPVPALPLARTSTARDSGPLWPFGYGLSYARFKYSDLVVETPEVFGNGVVRLRFNVENISSREGSDVVQVYFHNVTSPVTVPALRLACFKKFTLPAGGSTRLQLEFDTGAMAEWDRLVRRRLAEPGEYEILIGTSAEDIALRGKVTVR
ncbi:MAG: glycoside hydrolase family 3 C-terminal domain-containing protein [Puniceicoccales bacterium]|jgi:beta-glucosidase|nr:glycoside hydrolase family 3 C-terminal domain-containing protein [Puniceicoccales bacterium]